MSSRMTPTSRSALPQKKVQRRDRRTHSATQCALAIGHTILEKLRELPVGALTSKAIKRIIESTLTGVGFGTDMVSVSVDNNKVEAFIFNPKEKKRMKDSRHGHVIVSLDAKNPFYHRGYDMPPGAWNLCH